MPLWRGGPNTRTLPTVLLTPSASKASDMTHLCVPQNQALGVCRGPVPDIKVCGTHGREDLVKATITSNAEEEEEVFVIFVFTCLCSCSGASRTVHKAHDKFCMTIRRRRKSRSRSKCCSYSFCCQYYCCSRSCYHYHCHIIIIIIYILIIILLSFFFFFFFFFLVITINIVC